jgi:hypothetical protein
MNLHNQPNTFVPTNEQRRHLLHDSVFYEILFAFGVSPHDPTDYCAWEHINFSRMGHARTLYDFFETPVADRQQDDAISEDFGFDARPIDRPRDDRVRLNKDLFHVTYARLRHTNVTKPWPDTILSCLHERCVEFIRHVLSSGDRFGGPGELARWNDLLQALESGCELLISRPFSRTGVAPGYSLRLGSPLPSRLSELTKPCYRANASA